MNKKIGRNAPCPCGSGLKYKRCCEAKDLLASIDRSTVRSTLETVLSDLVYGSVLVGVWTLFHPEEEPPPEIEVLEDFYFEIYGCDLDRIHLDALILPLPAEVFAGLPTRPGASDPIVDITPAPDALDPVVSQGELFPPPLTSFPPPE